MLSTNIQNEIAQEFACLKDSVFLSSSFTTMPPICVQKAHIKFLDNWLSIFPNDQWFEWINGIAIEGRKEVAKLLNCSASNIAFVKNTTEGIGIIASGYPWKIGKNIIIPEQEHYACLHSWIPLSEKGIPIRPVQAKKPIKGLTSSDLIDAIDENTQAVVLSVIQYWDGAFVDMEKLGNVCREKGILLIVDAIQAVGRMVVDVQKWNIDWLSCGSHKGLLSMDGGGIVYCNPVLLPKIIPPYIGMESVTERSRIMEPNGLALNFKSSASRFEGGSLNSLGVTYITEACRLLNSIGIDNIEGHIIELEKYCLEQLKENMSGVRVMGDRLSGIIMFDFQKENNAEVKSILKKHKINATIRENNVRFCISFFNTVDDMDSLVSAIKEMQNMF